MESNLYYIDPSETSRESSFNSPRTILSGSKNYSTWYIAMTRALNSKKKLGFVDGTIEVPPKDHRNYGAWKQCNDHVLSWIVKSISPEIASSVKKMKSAVDVWRDLKKRFSPGLQSMILDILDKIHSLKQGTRDVGSYFEEFSVIWSDLELLQPVPDCACATKCRCGAMKRVKEERENEKVGRFLKGLDKHRFGRIRSRIMREDPLPPLSQVYISVFQEAKAKIVTARHHSSQTQPPSASTKTVSITSAAQPQQEARRSKQILVDSIHPYPLTWRPARESYTCSGCKELAFGPSYCCESSECTECNQKNGIFVLDKICADAVVEYYNSKKSRSPVHHPFFKKSNFYFREKPPGYPRYCDGCTKSVTGFVYHCSETSKDLHPRCLKLKSSVFNREEGVTVTLELRQKIDTEKTKCQICRKINKFDKSGEGWAYVSSNGDHCFHVSCFKELVQESCDEHFKQELKKQIRGSSNELEESRNKPKTKEVVRGSSNHGGKKMAIRIASVVFKLVKLLFPLIFGNPVSFVFGLLEPVVTNYFS